MVKVYQYSETWKVHRIYLWVIGAEFNRSGFALLWRKPSNLLWRRWEPFK